MIGQHPTETQNLAAEIVNSSVIACMQRIWWSGAVDEDAFSNFYRNSVSSPGGDALRIIFEDRMRILQAAKKTFLKHLDQWRWEGRIRVIQDSLS